VIYKLSFKNEVNMSTQNIYMDHAATTLVHPDALAAMLPCFGYHYGNPGSLYSLGKKAGNLVDEARSRTASLIGARPEEIIFTSGGTESDNLAIKGAAFASRKKGGHIITCASEHHAVLNTCEWLEDIGFTVTYLPVDSYGILNLDDVKKAVTKDTILITVMHANNETGTVQPIEEIGKIAGENGILFHTDAVQSAGKIPIDAAGMNVDLLSFSSHKIYGPKGVGALYVKNNAVVSPLFSGGGQEKGLRSGTENVTGIVGFGRACEIALDNLGHNILHIKSLKDCLEQMLLEKLPDAKINGHPTERLPHILSISFEGIEAESIIAALDAYGICASAGAACNSKSIEPSHVLTAMQVAPKLLYGTLRLSLGWENTEDQIFTTVNAINNIINEFREFAAKGYAETSYLLFSDINKAREAKLAINKRGIDCIFAAVPPRLRSLSASNTSAAISSENKTISLKTLSGISLEPLAIHDIQGIGRYLRNSQLSKKEHSFWEDVTGS
jgi:cysteine desulfurase